MISTLILYESTFGFTEKMAKNLALILGPAKYIRASEFNLDPKNYEAVLICPPIYSEGIDKNMLKFISENSHWIKEKKVILFCSSFAANISEESLKPIRDILGKSILYETSIVNRDDLLISENFVHEALKIKSIKDAGNKILDKKTLRKYIDAFINNHNTCALCTGHLTSTRATPIEYIYEKDCLYIISEGGEKFSNILVNKNVSICIYDSYSGMNKLSGMQIKGEAEIIDVGSKEYCFAMQKKSLDLNNINKLPISLNLIKVNILKIEFLWSEFKKLGYDAKQVLCIK